MKVELHSHVGALGRNLLPSSPKVLEELISSCLYDWGWPVDLFALLIISWNDTQLFQTTLRFLPCGPLHRQLARWQFAFSRPAGIFLSPICYNGVCLFSQIPSEDCVLGREWPMAQICKGRGAWELSIGYNNMEAIHSWSCQEIFGWRNRDKSLVRIGSKDNHRKQNRDSS